MMSAATEDAPARAHAMSLAARPLQLKLCVNRSPVAAIRQCTAELLPKQEAGGTQRLAGASHDSTYSFLFTRIFAQRHLK